MQICDVKRWGVDFGNVLVQNFSWWTRWKLWFAILWCAMQHWRRWRYYSLQDPSLLKFLFSYCDLSKALDPFLRRHTKLIPDAILGLRRLVQKVGTQNVWIVSRVRNAIEREINFSMMLQSGIFSDTGLSPDHAFFVERYEQKARICARLGIDGFIDDNPRVLGAMRDVPCLVFFGSGTPCDRRALAYIAAQGVRSVHVVYEWRYIWNRLHVCG